MWRREMRQYWRKRSNTERSKAITEAPDKDWCHEGRQVTVQINTNTRYSTTPRPACAGELRDWMNKRLAMLQREGRLLLTVQKLGYILRLGYTAKTKATKSLAIVMPILMTIHIVILKTLSIGTDYSSVVESKCLTRMKTKIMCEGGNKLNWRWHELPRVLQTPPARIICRWELL